MSKVYSTKFDTKSLYIVGRQSFKPWLSQGIPFIDCTSVKPKNNIRQGPKSLYILAFVRLSHPKKSQTYGKFPLNKN